MNAKHVTVAAAAKILHVSPGRVRQFLATGRLRSERWGWQHVINVSDLKTMRRGRQKKSKSA